MNKTPRDDISVYFPVLTPPVSTGTLKPDPQQQGALPTEPLRLAYFKASESVFDSNPKLPLPSTPPFTPESCLLTLTLCCNSFLESFAKKSNKIFLNTNVCMVWSKRGGGRWAGGRRNPNKWPSLESQGVFMDSQKYSSKMRTGE